MSLPSCDKSCKHERYTLATDKRDKAKLLRPYQLTDPRGKAVEKIPDIDAAIRRREWMNGYEHGRAIHPHGYPAEYGDDL